MEFLKHLPLNRTISWINNSKLKTSYSSSLLINVHYPGQRRTAGTGWIRCISGAFHWNTPETHRKMEAVFHPELSRIFSFWQEFTGKNSGRNTASISEEFPVLSHGIRWLFRIFPPRSRRIWWPESSSWVFIVLML